MTAPIAVVSIISWIKHPFKGNKNDVEINEIMYGDITISVNNNICKIELISRSPKNKPSLRGSNKHMYNFLIKPFIKTTSF